MKPLFLFMYLMLGLFSLSFAGNNVQSIATFSANQGELYGPNPPKAQRFSTFSEFLKEKLAKPGKGRKWEIALILCIVSLFTIHGIHRLYLGYIWIGLAQMFLNIFGGLMYTVSIYLFLLAFSSGTIFILPLILAALGLLMVIGAFVWWLIDIIRLSKRSLLPKIEEYIS